MVKDKPLTLEEVSKHMFDAFDVSKAAEDIMRQNLLTDMLFYGYKPPTRKERIKYWFEDKKQRAKDIWTILKGDDIHKDCGY